jgi:hypothetical protein
MGDPLIVEQPKAIKEKDQTFEKFGKQVMKKYKKGA